MNPSGFGTMTIAVAAAAALSLGAAPQSPQSGDWELVVLGIAQDAGIPQLGCAQELCTSIRAGKRKRERVSSIGLVHRRTGRAYLFDATPDLPSQLESLTGGRVPAGIFLTHAHAGHYTGLMYLGREAIDAKSVPVYGTARMQAFLGANGPWSLLVSRGNIATHALAPDRATELDDGVRVTALAVPHRDEFTDTVGYLIETPARKAVFIPDIDQWQKWSRDIRALVDGVDYAFLDGTFASADEIPGRTTADIPHPLMPASRALLKGARARVWFIHLNHTNRELEASDVARDGMRLPM
jgi:pyrroloquinoline quinone biosynthesis protein B